MQQAAKSGIDPRDVARHGQAAMEPIVLFYFHISVV
jgi:hypothetical protein